MSEVLEEPKDIEESKRLYSALFHMSNERHECYPFIKMIRNSLIELDNRIRWETDQVVFKHLQGAAQVLDNIIKLADSAKNKLNDLEKQQNTRRQ